MAETNPNSRLEAFCDGVFAIALTLLIIDVRLPATVQISSTADFWIELKDMLPSILAFLFSFTIIFITWANHHAAFKLVHGSSSSFVYANGLLLLTVVFIPFPTALLGQYLLSDFLAPAVILYNGVIALQAVGWILVTGAALRNHLTKDEKSTEAMRVNQRNGYFAFVVYSLFAIMAFWFPRTIVVVTTLLWGFWLIHGINMVKPSK